MKKTICVLLSFVILALSCFSLGLCGFAENRIENVEKEHLNSFIEGIAELSRNYQAEDKCSSENEFDFGNELTISDFKTARIIVESKESFENRLYKPGKDFYSTNEIVTTSPGELTSKDVEIFADSPHKRCQFADRNHIGYHAKLCEN